MNYREREFARKGALLDMLEHEKAFNIKSSDATIVYNAMAKLYGDGRFIFRKYSRTFKRLDNGYEYRDSDNSLSGEPLKVERVVIDDEEGTCDEDLDFREDNLTRSRNLLIDLACQNYKYFKSFVTLTFADEVYDLDEANKKFKSFITQVRRKYPDFKFLGVPEFQKGGRVHYHLMTNIDVDSVIIPKREKKHTFNPDKGKHVWLEYYDIKYWKYGFSSAFSLETMEDNFSVTLYVLKYLYKSPDIRLWGRNKVLASRNLDRPNILYLSSESEEYNNVLKYISEHNYDVYTYESDKQFVPSFIQFSNIK